MSALLDGEENIMDTSWLDIIMIKLLPSSPVWIRVWNRYVPGSGSNSVGYRLFTVEANNDCCANFLPCDASQELTCVVCTK